MKREIIFDMPDTYGKYRMVCRFGYDNLIDYAWWGHLQKRITVRFLFGKKEIWHEVNQCWWSFDINSMEELKKAAYNFYDERVELPMRLKEKAMSI